MYSYMGVSALITCSANAEVSNLQTWGVSAAVPRQAARNTPQILNCNFCQTCPQYIISSVRVKVEPPMYYYYAAVTRSAPE